MNPLRVALLNISRVPPIILLSAVVGLAGTAAWTVSAQLDATKKASQVAQDDLNARLNAKGKAVFALKDIPEGQLITADALEEREMAATQVPTDAISAASLVAGRTAKYGISANQIVSQHDLASATVPQGFESQLKPGQRAITFGVDNNSGVAGFIGPQSRIDILASVGGASDTKVAPILSDVRVIAVGPTFQKVPGSANNPAGNITVAVDPSDAKKLVTAIVASKLYVTLRNENDHTPVATVDVTSLYNKPAVPKDSMLISAGQLPAPPILPEAAIVPSQMSQMQMPPAPKMNREIEMWTGSKKDVLSVPNS